MTRSSPQVPAGTPQAFWLEELGQADAFTRWVFEQTSEFIEGAVLEVGCGQGTYTRLLAPLASRVVAVDLNEAFVAAARRVTRDYAHVSVRCADATKDLGGEHYDTIVLFDVLEHLEDDRHVLRSLCQMLRPGGRLILKVPAFSWLYGAMDSAVGHHRRYSRAGLMEALHDSGFGVPQTWFFNAAAMPGWWFNGVLLGRKTPPATQLSLFERVLPIAKAIDRWTRPYAGLSVFAVANRPPGARTPPPTSSFSPAG